MTTTPLSTRIDTIRGDYRPLLPVEPFSGPNIFLFRQAETIADVFPDWIQRCELDAPFYVPFDLNMPISVPRRPSMRLAYEHDPPISEIGKICTQMLARDLVARRGLPIKAIYTAPSLAAIQTAEEIAHYLGEGCGPIRLNADLCANRRGAEFWLTRHQLHNLGYHVDDDYDPMADMETARTMESCQTVLKNFIQDIATLDGNVIVVADSLAVKCISDWANDIVRQGVGLQTAYEIAEKSFPPGATCTLKVLRYMEEVLVEPSPVSLRPITAVGMSTAQNKEADMVFS